MNTNELENKLIVLSLHTINLLFSYTNGADLIALYLFYHKQCKIQGTNQSFTTTTFAKDGLNWGATRFAEAKKILKDLGLVEDIVTRDNGLITGHFIKVNYILSDTEAKETTSLETDTLEESRLWLPEHKCLKIYKLNAGSIKDKDICPSKEKKTDLKDLSFADIVEVRNSVKSVVWKKFTTVERTKIYRDTSLLYGQNIQRDYTKEEFYNGLEKYLKDIDERKPSTDKSSYYYHRFSLYEFLKQGNGLKKFAFL